MLERPLGFDARIPFGGLPSPWDAARRELFLLRGDVLTPLSVDTLVWPSLFDSGQGTGLSANERIRFGLTGPPLPPYTGPQLPLWPDLASLTGYLRQFDAQPGVLIAITLVSGLDTHAPDGDAATFDAGRRLGYDVADRSMLSGLSNCGYPREEAARLRPEWAPLLNGHGLFDDPTTRCASALLPTAAFPNTRRSSSSGFTEWENRRGCIGASAGLRGKQETRIPYAHPDSLATACAISAVCAIIGVMSNPCGTMQLR